MRQLPAQTSYTPAPRRAPHCRATDPPRAPLSNLCPAQRNPPNHRHGTSAASPTQSAKPSPRTSAAPRTRPAPHCQTSAPRNAIRQPIVTPLPAARITPRITLPPRLPTPPPKSKRKKGQLHTTIQLTLPESCLGRELESW